MQPAVTPEEAYILRKNHRYLLTNLPYEAVKDHLYQEGILDLHDLDDLDALKTPKNQNEKIIKLVNRHPGGYKALLKFLKDPANKEDWIAKELSATDTSQFHEIRKWRIPVWSSSRASHNEYEFADLMNKLFTTLTW